MKVNLTSRPTLIWNLIFFLICSFIFLHVQVSLVNDISAFNIHLLRQNMEVYRTAFIIIALTIVGVFTLKKWSSYLLMASIGLVMWESVSIIINDFNKLILLMLFFYLIVSYYFYQFWLSEVREAYFCPNFSENTLYSPMLKKISAKIRAGDHLIQGHLTNWNENGCFIEITEPLKEKFKRGKLEILFEQHTFVGSIVVVSVSQNKKGIGLKFHRDEQDGENFSLPELVNLCEELGWSPEVLK